MIKKMFPYNVVFDIETVPDIETARRVYPELEAMAEAAELGIGNFNVKEMILKHLYQIHGATEDNPRPMLRYRFHKIVSISALEFGFKDFKIVNPRMHAFKGEEKQIIETFLHWVGHHKPQLVGWSSQGFDIPMLTQRAIITRARAPKFFERPDKPWEGVDYFAKGSEANVDLYEIIRGTSFSKDSGSPLSDFCRAIGVPGKIGVSGGDVAAMWAEDRIEELTAYNATDVLSTFLVYLHVMMTSGWISIEEMVRVKRELFAKISVNAHDHWQRYSAEWQLLDADVQTVEEVAHG